MAALKGCHATRRCVKTGEQGKEDMDKKYLSMPPNLRRGTNISAGTIFLYPTVIGTSGSDQALKSFGWGDYFHKTAEIGDSGLFFDVSAVLQ
jgi:hypothetical protein